MDNFERAISLGTDEQPVDWIFWCRLCAKEDLASNTNVFFKEEQQSNEVDGLGCSQTYLDLSTLIAKFFRVNVTQDDVLPKMLCTDCYSLVTSLEKFSTRIVKVQEMFVMLENSRGKKITLSEIRLKFGLLDREVKEKVSIPRTETNTGDNDSILNETESRNPLELPSPLQINIKDENIVDSSDADEIVLLNHNTEVDFLKEEKILKNVRKTKDQQHIDSKREKQFHNADFVVMISGVAYAYNGIFICPECARRFKRLPHFKQHMMRSHGKQPPDITLKCPECDRTFNEPWKYRIHSKKHIPLELKRVIPCSLCEKMLSSEASLHKHISYVHNNERPYVCEECGEAVATNNDLREHMLTHTEYAPFVCEVCQKAFKTEKRLKKHTEIHAPIKYTCAECGLELNTRWTYKTHLLVHSDEMTHKCDFCGRAFKRAKTLKNHLILHTGLKPYSCDFCDRTFASGSNCRSHKKKAHPVELAALEASGGGKAYKRRIPKLKALKAATKNGGNLKPVVSKQSGCFATSRNHKHLTEIVGMPE